MMFLGEFPALPPDFIRPVRRPAMDIELRLTERAWEIISQGLPEGWIVV